QVEGRERAQGELRLGSLQRQEGELGAAVDDLGTLPRVGANPGVVRRGVGGVHDQEVALGAEVEDDQVVQHAAALVAEDRVLPVADAQAADVVHGELLADRGGRGAARWQAAANSTSPQSLPSGPRFMPTSITTAPGRIHAPRTRPACPVAATSTSARPTSAPRSMVRE